MIAVVEEDRLDAGPIFREAAADATQVGVVIRQALAGRVIPVVPEGAEIGYGDGIRMSGDGLEEVVAVEGEIGGGFFHGFQTVCLRVRAHSFSGTE